MFAPADLLDLDQFAFPELFADCRYAWEVLPRLADGVRERLVPGQQGELLGTPYLADDIQVGAGTVIEHGAVVKGPTIIGANCQVRAGAYIRGHVIVGDDCVLGNASEFKNAILFNGAQVPHFSYVGDSVLGYRAHLGAGVILSNLKATAGAVTVMHERTPIETGLRKFGAIIGDRADIGCNSVLNPGSVIGRDSILYPNTLWRGVCPAGSIVKLRQEHQTVTRR